jgi:hypothetical protein
MRRFKPAVLRRTLAVLALSAFSIFAVLPARAITARDVTEKMSKEDRYNYLTGLIDMRAFQAAQSGDNAFSKCVNDAYYRDKEGSAWAAVLESLQKFPDRQAATIVFLLTQKMCGS